MTSELIDDIFEAAVSHLANQAGEHRIVIEPAEEILLVRIDASLIIQVLTNLVGNAIKYTPAGSIIRLYARREGAFVRVTVADDGPGVADDDKPHVFDRFYSGAKAERPADAQRSFGLGLALCRSIVEAHGALSRCTTTCPMAPSFRSRFLQRRLRFMDKESKWAASAGADGAVLSVLVVEDDAAVRRLIATALAMHGYHVEVAATGEAAILEAASHGPDLVLLDLGLPDVDGIVVIKKLRSWSNVPIIVISARIEETDKIEALDTGADDYLTKPFSVEELLARVRAWQRRARMSLGDDPGESVFENGPLRVDYAAGCAYLNGEELHLTPIEYKLLVLMCKNVGKVLTHTYLTHEIWGTSWDSDIASCASSWRRFGRRSSATPRNRSSSNACGRWLPHAAAVKLQSHQAPPTGCAGCPRLPRKPSAHAFVRRPS